MAPADRISQRRRFGTGFFAGMRVRKKLMFLHTLFSVGLAIILLVALRPAIGEVVWRAEISKAKAALTSVEPGSLGAPDIVVRSGTADLLAIDEQTAAQARATPGEAVALPNRDGAARAARFQQEGPGGYYVLAEVRIPEARSAVVRLYAFMVIAVVGVYVLVAGALEVFVLPQHVYGPIRRILAADRALQEGRQDAELIDESAIRTDELGEIMRSRNEAITSLRRHERALADALTELERVATDLKRKNHLLENAKRNLADADRLASLGMMSAGIAHELNTPLAVVKGLVDKLGDSGSLTQAEISLLARVVTRLEGLSESLLDFARARPTERRPVELHSLIDEAWTLVRIDRGAKDVTFDNETPQSILVACDADRMIQVFVNLLRNAVDAMSEQGAGRIRVTAERSRRDGAEWASISVIDSGPGIDPVLLSTLFEPFVSTHLDARGSGLGLAVAEGIVGEHGGVMLARNRQDGSGAVFEIMLPMGATTETAPA
jgi:C4-dicarboxylate-specific signal transduction histidine kinase